MTEGATDDGQPGAAASHQVALKSDGNEGAYFQIATMTIVIQGICVLQPCDTMPYRIETKFPPFSGSFSLVLFLSLSSFTWTIPFALGRHDRRTRKVVHHWRWGGLLMELRGGEGIGVECVCVCGFPQWRGSLYRSLSEQIN